MLHSLVDSVKNNAVPYFRTKLRTFFQKSECFLRNKYGWLQMMWVICLRISYKMNLMDILPAQLLWIMVLCKETG